MQCLRCEVLGEEKLGRVLSTLETRDKEGRPWSQGCEGWQEGAWRAAQQSSELCSLQKAIHRRQEGPQAHQEVGFAPTKRDESWELTSRDREGVSDKRLTRHLNMCTVGASESFKCCT